MGTRGGTLPCSSFFRVGFCWNLGTFGTFFRYIRLREPPIFTNAETLEKRSKGSIVPLQAVLCATLRIALLPRDGWTNWNREVDIARPSDSA